jgi:hypothetical protein
MFPTGPITIDSAGTPKTIPSYGNRDILVFKYSCDSVFQWVIRIGGTLADGGAFFNSRLAIDTSGSIGQEELTDFLSEIVGMAKGFKDKLNMTLLTHDCIIQNDYSVENGNIAKSFPKSFNDWLNLKNELVTLSGLKTSASCPRNITKEEEDGVWFVGKGHDMSFDENQINQKVLDTVRSEAIGNCEIGKNRTKVLISKKPLLSSSASKKSGNSCVFALVLK